MNKFITETFQIWCKNSHHCHVQVKKIVMMFTEVFALVPLSTGVPLSVSTVKNLPANARDVGSISGSGRSPGGGNGNPLQYPCLVNCIDRGAWWATVCRIANSWTQLSTHTNTHTHIPPNVT